MEITGEENESFPDDPAINADDPINDPAILDVITFYDIDGNITASSAGDFSRESPVLSIAWRIFMSHIEIATAQNRTRLWEYLETELLKSNALLLPLRLFIGLGWLRAGVEKLIDPLWWSGDKVTAFFEHQIAADAVYFPIYNRLITQLFEPNAFALSWIILIGELLVGISILTGTLTNLGLLAGIFMNLNFVLAGVVNPSAFYIVIQAVLLSANSGAALGMDSVLSRYSGSFLIAQPVSLHRGNRPSRRRTLLVGGILCALMALLAVPYIRDFGPHSVDDPAMLLFILLSLGAMLLGIHFVRVSARLDEWQP